MEYDHLGSAVRDLTKNSDHVAFVSTLRHALRTPINGVLGMAELLLDSPLDAEQREQVGAIVASAQTLSTLVNDTRHHRASRRWPVALRVVWVREGERVELSTVDVSAEGMLLRTAEEAAVRSLLSLEGEG